MDHLITVLLGLAAMLVSLSVHEFAHAAVATQLGDDTARRMGRLTLNPLAHADLVGTFLIPMLGAFTGLPVFGWAKPVPYNPYNLRLQKWGPTLVGLAGPASNFVGAAFFLAALKVAVDVAGLGMDNLLVYFLYALVLVNVSLGLFNLIPIPPLDGANILSPLLEQPKHRDTRLFLETRGPMILLALVVLDGMAGPSFFGMLVRAVAGLGFRVFGL